MYVAMTRAKDVLYLLHARERMLYGEYRSNSPSQFLQYIPENLLESNMPNIRVHTGIMGKVKDMLTPKTKPIPSEGLEFSGEFKDGDKVSHPKFGEGIVVQITGGIVVVAFNDPKVGIKKLAVSFAPLSKI